METFKSDRELIGEIARLKSAAAFEEIVERYSNAVYGAAVRQAGASMADDVTQAVFLILWQKASRVRDGSILAGWLMNTTRFVAMQSRRAEQRRQRRQQVALQVSQNQTQLGGDSVNPTSDKVALLLDEGLGQLDDAERSALVMRYLQGKSLAEVAAIAGISEAAAAKRVSRAVIRLRTYFAKRGLDIPSAAIGPALAEQAVRIHLPAGYAKTVVSSVTGVPSSAVTALAQSAQSSRTAHLLRATALLGVILLLLAAGAFQTWTLSTSGSDKVVAAPPEAHTDIAPKPAMAQAPLFPPIKVGVLVSLATANGSPMWKFDKQAKICRDMRAGDIELHGIVETGAASATGMAPIIKQYFSGRPPIECTDVTAMKSLDVIVMTENWISTPEMEKAVDAAVTDGAGLLNYHGLGSMQPGPGGGDPIPAEVAGLTRAYFATIPDTVKCKVLAPHPILGTLKVGDLVSLRPMGLYGVLPGDGVPLVQVLDNTPLQTTDDLMFYPLYLSHLGKGKIVSCQYARTTDAGTPPMSANSKFVLRSVRWLAGRNTETGAPEQLDLSHEQNK